MLKGIVGKAESAGKVSGSRGLYRATGDAGRAAIGRWEGRWVS